jgi:hypothetical protein
MTKRQAFKTLRSQKEIICLDLQAHVTWLVLKSELIAKGEFEVELAALVKGY